MKQLSEGKKARISVLEIPAIDHSCGPARATEWYGYAVARRPILEQQCTLQVTVPRAESKLMSASLASPMKARIDDTPQPRLSTPPSPQTDHGSVDRMTSMAHLFYAQCNLTVLAPSSRQGWNCSGALVKPYCQDASCIICLQTLICTTALTGLHSTFARTLASD